VLNETSGHPIIGALAAASREFFEHPPDGFVDHPLLSPRGLMWVGRAGDEPMLDTIALQDHVTDVRCLEPGDVLDIVACMRAAAVAGGGVFEPSAMSIDTDALLHSFLRGLRDRGGRVLTGLDVTALHPADSGWTVVADQVLHAPIVVNATGAWGDVIAQLAGVRPIGLQPMRRTACIAALDDVDRSWPLVMDVAGRYYFEPEAGGLLVSPADETPSPPCDVQAEEEDVAIALDELREATTLPVRRVRRAWAGLRTFAPDRAPVVGEAVDAPGFWWLVGQGGGGIKTAPALAAALAALVRGEPLPATIAARGCTTDQLAAARFDAPAA
jgi:D-arginine dehydrogenase